MGCKFTGSTNASLYKIISIFVINFTKYEDNHVLFVAVDNFLFPEIIMLLLLAPGHEFFRRFVTAVDARGKCILVSICYQQYSFFYGFY